MAGLTMEKNRIRSAIEPTRRSVPAIPGRRSSCVRNPRDAAYRPTLSSTEQSTWEILSETPLPAPAANDVWVVDGVVYVETEGNQLQAYTLSPKLTPVWPAPFALPGRLSGAPLKQGNELLLTTVAGDVLLLDGQGQPVKHIPTEQAFVTGPELHLGHPLATTLDGSIYLLDQLLQVETVNQGGN